MYGVGEGDGENMDGKRSISRLFVMLIRQPPRSTQSRSSEASDVCKRRGHGTMGPWDHGPMGPWAMGHGTMGHGTMGPIHISEPTTQAEYSYAAFC